jgi:hypothetical protein
MPLYDSAERLVRFRPRRFPRPAPTAQNESTGFSESWQAFPCGPLAVAIGSPLRTGGGRWGEGSSGPCVGESLLDDLVGAGEQGRWDRMAEHFRRLEVNHELEFRRRLHG